MKKRHILLSIIKIIFVSFAISFILIAGTILYKAKKYPDKVPDIFGYKPMIVLSGSMETSINTGDLVLVKMVDTTTLKKGDVIAFRNEQDTVTTHRIVDTIFEDNKQYFKTKGDANNVEDTNLVSTEDVEGLYVGRIPKAGKVLMFMQKPMGLFTVLLIILVIGLLWLYIISRRDYKKYIKLEEKDRLEFEEFKRKRELEHQEGNNKDKNKKKVN